MNPTMQIRLLGVRGTLPVHGPEFARFGGATSCVLVRAGGETIILDAGTGLSGRAWDDFFPEQHRDSAHHPQPCGPPHGVSRVSAPVCPCFPL